MRQHRSRPGALRVVLVACSYAFAVLPWFFPSATALAAGLAAHVVWFVATDRLARGGATTQTASAALRGASSPPPPRPFAPAPGTSPNGFTALPVLAVIDETPDIRTFRLGRPTGWTFKAGQFLPVRLRVDGHEHVRCYSISSAPGAEAYLEISVKRQGMVSSALHATLRPGGTLFARTPAGRFVYPSDDDRPIVLIAAGVGITPLMSMVRHAVLADPQRSITLVHSARRMDGLAFADELRVIERRHPTFRWVPSVTSGETAPACYPGRIDEALLRAAVPELADAVVGICGPDAMITATRGLLDALGVPPGQVRYELFDAVTASTGSRIRSPEPEGRPNAAIVTFLKSQVQHPACEGQTLLEAAEGGGVAIPTVCRSGVCGTCRTRVVSGDVHCPADTLDAGDIAAGYVLACVSPVRTDCSVEA